MPFIYQKPNEIIKVSMWGNNNGSEIYPEGSRDKNLVYSPANVPFDFLRPSYAYLMKYPPRRAPQEYFAEIIAYRLGDLMGVEVPNTFLAIDNEHTGVLSEWFYDFQGQRSVSEFLHVPGGDIALRMINNFDRDRGLQHNIKFLLRMDTFIKQLSKELKYEVLLAPLEDILKMLTFDALIGNTDRHQDNWSILLNIEKKSMRFSPIFDNGSSLGFEMHPKKAAFKCEKAPLENYINRGAHHLKWNEVDGERIPHMALIDYLCQEVSVASSCIAKCLDFSLKIIEEYIYHLREYDVPDRLTTDRANFIVSLIQIRYTLLSEIVKKYK